MESTSPPAGETEPRLASTTDSDVLRSFRDALVALYPVLHRLYLLEDDTQPYDDFDRVAEVLWEVIVLTTFAWREGVQGLPKLPRYGFSKEPIGANGFIEVRAPGLSAFRFIEFIGDRSIGVEPFNAIHGVGSEGNSVTCAFGPDVLFSWVRGAA